MHPHAYRPCLRACCPRGLLTCHNSPFLATSNPFLDRLPVRFCGLLAWLLAATLGLHEGSICARSCAVCHTALQALHKGLPAFSWVTDWEEAQMVGNLAQQQTARSLAKHHLLLACMRAASETPGMHSVLDPHACINSLNHVHAPARLKRSKARLCRCTRHPLAILRPDTGSAEAQPSGSSRCPRVCTKAGHCLCRRHELAQARAVLTAVLTLLASKEQKQEDPTGRSRTICTLLCASGAGARLGAGRELEAGRGSPKTGIRALNAGGSASQECGSKVSAVTPTQPQTNPEEESVHDICLFSWRAAPAPTCTPADSPTPRLNRLADPMQDTACRWGQIGGPLTSALPCCQALPQKHCSRDGGMTTCPSEICLGARQPRIQIQIISELRAVLAVAACVRPAKHNYQRNSSIASHATHQSAASFVRSQVLTPSSRLAVRCLPSCGPTHG